MENQEKIALLNDKARTSLTGCKLFITSWVESLKNPAGAIKAMQEFSEFTEDNDPYKEHDFWAFNYEWVKLYWKFDYYAKGSEEFGSPDSSDEETTDRVLTLYLAEEH